MNHQMGVLAALAVLGVLIFGFVLLYRKLHRGGSQAGLHLQALGAGLAWLGGVAAFVGGRVELGSALVLLGFGLGVLGLLVHTRK